MSHRTHGKPAWLASQQGNCSQCGAPFSSYQAGGQYHDSGLCSTCATSPAGGIYRYPVPLKPAAS